MPHQPQLFKPHWQHRYSHGGTLRNSSKGRGSRPLSSKDPLHLVFKINKASVKGGLRSPQNFRLLHLLLKKYSFKFFVRVEQFSIENDHIHLLIRATRRTQFQSFFRVIAGQFSQRLTDTFHEKYQGPKIWKYRPFSRVVKGFKGYKIVRNYIRLNELEATGQRPYSKTRLRGMSAEELQELWC
jgi:REP element-mobilizing transposase RayT